MKKVLNMFLLIALVAVNGFAQETASVGKMSSDYSVWFFVGIVLAAMIGLGIAAAGCGLAQGNAVSKAVEGIARQPEATQKIQTALIIGLGFIESLTIYVFVIILILFFANPFLKYVCN